MSGQSMKKGESVAWRYKPFLPPPRWLQHVAPPYTVRVCFLLAWRLPFCRSGCGYVSFHGTLCSRPCACCRSFCRTVCSARSRACCRVILPVCCRVYGPQSRHPAVQWQVRQDQCCARSKGTQNCRWQYSKLVWTFSAWPVLLVSGFLAFISMEL